MTTRLNPYISFGGNAREAMTFYQGVFGGTLTSSTFGEFGAPSEEPDNIMHSTLEGDNGVTLMGADALEGPAAAPEGMSISLSGDDSAQLRGYWEKLSAGGSVQVPMEKQMWGDEFGMCTDKFGICWMVNIAQPQG